MLTPDTLRAAGEALYGPRWQTALAHDLGVTYRTVRRWAAGSHPIPARLAGELKDLLSERAKTLRRAAGAL